MSPLSYATSPIQNTQGAHDGKNRWRRSKSHTATDTSTGNVLEDALTKRHNVKLEPKHDTSADAFLPRSRLSFREETAGDVSDITTDMSGSVDSSSGPMLSLQSVSQSVLLANSELQPWTVVISILAVVLALSRVTAIFGACMILGHHVTFDIPAWPIAWMSSSVSVS